MLTKHVSPLEVLLIAQAHEQLTAMRELQKPLSNKSFMLKVVDFILKLFFVSCFLFMFGVLLTKFTLAAL